jgi:putative membrane protein
MIVAALLSAIHLLTLALGLGAVVWRGRALASPLDDRGWGNVLAADTAWGIAAGLWIASGVARLFFGGKEPGFYTHNGFFWIKMALFAAVFLLELAPMIAFTRVRAARRGGQPPPPLPLATFQRINAVEVALVIVIVVVATFMARGAWLF